MNRLDDFTGDGGNAAFLSTVAARYLELRGAGLVLSSLDAERIRNWAERGVPVELALRSLERARDRWRAGGRARRRRPFPLRLAEQEIERELGKRKRRGLGEAPLRSTSAQSSGYPARPLSNPSDPRSSMESDDFHTLANPIMSLLGQVQKKLERTGPPPERQRASNCPSCRGKGYFLGTEGSFAVAKLCGCERYCEACGGRGFLIREQDGYEFSKRCECQTLPQRVAAYNAAQLPARFWNKTFDNFYVTRDDPRAISDAKEAFYNFAHGQGPSLGLGLIGGPGRGKTHLLAATLASLTLKRGVRARYVEISFLFADLKAAISDPRARATVDKIDELAQVDVLAIDELGKGRGSVFEEEVLDELIGRRYNNEKPTLFATNHPLEERDGEALGESLLARLGPRIFSRLHEMVVFLELPAKASDHRLLLRKMMR